MAVHSRPEGMESIDKNYGILNGPDGPHNGFMPIDFGKAPLPAEARQHSYSESEKSILRMTPLDTLSFTGSDFRCPWNPSANKDASNKNFYFAPPIFRGGGVADNGHSERTASLKYEHSKGVWTDHGHPDKIGGDLIDLVALLMCGEPVDSKSDVWNIRRSDFFPKACDFLAGIRPEIKADAAMSVGVGTVTVLEGSFIPGSVTLESSEVLPERSEILSHLETLYLIPEFEMSIRKNGKTYMLDLSSQPNIVALPSRKREVLPDGKRQYSTYLESDRDGLRTRFEDLLRDVSLRLDSGAFVSVVLCDRYMYSKPERFALGQGGVMEEPMRRFADTLKGAGRHAELSNSAPRSFSVYTRDPATGAIRKDDYCSVSQYMCAEKARFMGDLSALNAIMSSENPATYEHIAKAVSIPEDRQADWKKFSEDAIRTAVYRSFEYNPEYKRKLLVTGAAVIRHQDPRTAKALMDVRNTFRLYESQKADEGYKWHISERQNGFTDEGIKSYLVSRGISLGIADRFCEQVRVKRIISGMTPEEIKNKRSIVAIGFRTKSGSYVLRTPPREKVVKVGNKWETVRDAAGNPVMDKGIKNNVDGADISLLMADRSLYSEKDPTDRPESASDRVFIVEGFMDALSIEQDLADKGKAQDFDLLVLNSTSNYEKAVPFIKAYKEVHSFLDADKSGRECVDKLLPLCEQSGIAFTDETSKAFPKMETRYGVKIKDFNDALMAKKGLLTPSQGDNALTAKSSMTRK